MSSTQVTSAQNVDDDGRPRRTGTLMSVTAHIITAVIGSGVLTLAWSIAQLGWIAGPTVLLGFALITYYTSTLLADLYRSPDGTRNRTYTEVVRSTLGGYKVVICGVAQYINLIGVTIGYSLTASLSLLAVEQSICYHNHKEGPIKCSAEKQAPFMILFACIQIILSQVPNFHKLSWLSVLAAIMSFAYSASGLGLSIAKVAGGGEKDTSLSPMLGKKPFFTFQAIGNIAFAYAYATILTEIQDTLKSSPAENVVMKKASLAGVSTTTLFYLLCGCTGYAAFGAGAPGNFLSKNGFREPYWLIAVANICVATHLVGAYQVFCQPIYSFVEMKCSRRWPDNNFINIHHRLRIPYFGTVVLVNFFRLVWRSLYVVATTVIAAKVPFFNELIGFVRAVSFYPLTVYFPIEMHISRSRVQQFSSRWIWLKTLTFVCLVVSIVAAVGSVHGIVSRFKKSAGDV